MLTALAVTVSSLVLADVGPRPPSCRPPESCRACSGPAGEVASSACVAEATDAGLVEQQCNDRSGSYFTLYYCPPGVTVARGCMAAPELSVLALLALIARRARRTTNGA